MAVMQPALITVTTTPVVVASFANTVFMPRAPISSSTTETLVPVTDRTVTYTVLPALLNLTGAYYPGTSQTTQYINLQPRYVVRSFPALGVNAYFQANYAAAYTYNFNNIPASASLTTGNVYTLKSVTVGVYNPNSNNGLITIPGFNWYLGASPQSAVVTVVDQNSSLQPPYQPLLMNVAESTCYTTTTVGNVTTAATNVINTLFTNTIGSSPGITYTTDLSVPYPASPKATAEASVTVSVITNAFSSTSSTNSQTVYWAMS